VANDAPASINDDRVRTWTVSSAHEDHDVSWFELTVREMKGGAMTGALFDVLRQNSRTKWESSIQLDTMNITADIVGITGDFYMKQGPIKLLLVAGGIGVTPFMAMLRALVELRDRSMGDGSCAISGYVSLTVSHLGSLQ
jgi:NAD(P)H-flavin reductase